jgi:type I restriction enzyme M protein
MLWFILRDDGLSFGDYVEQRTFLLFLKMADEQSRAPFNTPSPIPKGFDWPALVKVDGDDLETLSRHTLHSLGRHTGMSINFLRPPLTSCVQMNTFHP